MRERELFLAALEMEDCPKRQAYLKDECADDAELLAKVELLLASHDVQSRFLNTPALEQIAYFSVERSAAAIQQENGSTRDHDLDSNALRIHGSDGMAKHQDDSDDETVLAYLEPSSEPGSLGRLGHYEVLEVIGRGAFGTVLRAFDEKLQRVVAIKVMAPELASTSPARKRFIREAQASAAIRHENVVSVYAVEEKPIPYLVMEFIPGETLQQRLDKQGPLDVLAAVQIARQIAEGLAAAHAQDLVHRDIKPANILLETGARKMVKVTDFGLARAADDASVTQSGTIAGTPMYMAPEQALCKKLDHRADLFSTGSVLYQMVSGRPPFRANGTLAVLKRVIEDTPRPIREIIPETPQWLCDIISKLHAKNPDERYQSAREIADVLSNCESQLKTGSGLKNFAFISRATVEPAHWWKRVAVATLVLPLLTFGLYTINRLATRTVAKNDSIQQPTTNPNNLETVPSSIVAAPRFPSVSTADILTTEEDGWVQLFNGRDLTNWHSWVEDKWDVHESVLTGKGNGALLWSKGRYRDFHLRAMVRYKEDSIATITYRTTVEAFGEVSLDKNAGAVGGYDMGHPYEIAAAHSQLTQANSWYELELLVRGKHVTVKINGTTCTEADVHGMPEEGQIRLNAYEPGSVIEFRKIEIKELPPVVAASQDPPPFDLENAVSSSS